MGIPALYRANRMRSEQVASLRLAVWRGQGIQKTEVKQSPQALLFARERYNEYQTRFGFWETVEESLSWRNNAYVWRAADPQTGRVPEMFALHPDQVTCKPGGYYEVQVSDGYVDPVGRGKGVYHVGYEAILHIRGHGDGGTLEAPSPIKIFSQTIGNSLSRMRHESKVWERGSALQLAVQFPKEISHQKAKEWQQMWASTYDGVDGARTAVIGGGADIKPIGMTMQDAEFIALAKLTVEDASRISGVPSNLLGAQLERAVPNLEQDLSMWLRFGLGPELGRIETHLAADEILFPAGTDQYPMFDTEEFVRGDLLTEDAIAHARVQDGRLLVDEWRRSQGLDPLPNGAGMVPQVVPVGGGANPYPQKSPPAAPADSAAQ
jgi:HK97 family phage portal protein